MCTHRGAKVGGGGGSQGEKSFRVIPDFTTLAERDSAVFLGSWPVCGLCRCGRAGENSLLTAFLAALSTEGRLGPCVGCGGDRGGGVAPTRRGEEVLAHAQGVELQTSEHGGDSFLYIR